MAVPSKHVAEQEQLKVIQTFRHIRPGTRVDIEFRHETQFRSKAKVIGFDHNQFVLFSLPQAIIRDYPDIIREGNGCIVRSLVEGQAGQCIAYRSSVQAIPIRPKGLLFIDYPHQIESISLRKEDRLTAQYPVTIMHRDESSGDVTIDSKTEVQGQVCDISSGGCRILVNWPKGKTRIKEVPVFLKISMPNSNEFHLVKAEIKNQSREDPLTVSVGCMFVTDSALNKLFNAIGLS